MQFATTSLHKDSLLKHQRGRCKGLTSIYKCEACDKEFDRPANLKCHMAIHDKQYCKCNGCLKEYKWLDHFKNHICQVRRSKRNKVSFDESLDHPADIDLASYDLTSLLMPNDDDHDDMYDLADLSMAFAPVNEVIGSNQMADFFLETSVHKTL